MSEAVKTEHPHIVQVYHALSYFCDHRDEIMGLIAREEQANARLAGA